MRWPLSKRRTPGEIPERAKVYVTPKGKMYVKPEEVLNSKAGRRRVREMVRLAQWQKRRAKERRQGE